MKLKTLKDIPINKFIQAYGVKLIDGKYDFIKELKQAAIEWYKYIQRDKRELFSPVKDIDIPTLSAFITVFFNLKEDDLE